jgi:hypothetical protein
MYEDASELERKAGRIKLEPAEDELLDAIELDALKLCDCQHTEANADKVEELMSLLIARKAFPQTRQSYLTDPEYKPGPSKGSRMDIFIGNNGGREGMFRNTHFLQHLRYLIFGANLPRGAITEFCRAVAECGYVSSGDVDGLRKTVRRLVRTYRLNPSKASDEFCKLALDCEMGPHYADSMRRAAMQVK